MKKPKLKQKEEQQPLVIQTQSSNEIFDYIDGLGRQLTLSSSAMPINALCELGCQFLKIPVPKLNTKKKPEYTP